MPHILRTPQTQNRLDQETERVIRGEVVSDFDDPSLLLPRATHIFQHWFVVANRFPFDAIAERHDTIVPKRKVTSWNELTPKEHQEWEELKANWIPKHYDAILEMTPKAKSKGWLHVHLLILKQQ